MTFNNIDSLQLGNLLQIVFSNGVRNQISEDYRDWEYVSRYRYGNSAARELRFLFQTSFGPSAIQYRDPGTSGRSFPDADQATIAEYTAKFKELNATIELEYNLWDRARKSPEKYAEPLALEIQSKTTASKRRIAADFYGDGTGVIGQALDAGTIASGRVEFNQETANSARGHVGFFEFGDRLTPHNPDGTAANPTVSSGTFSYYRVESKDRKNDRVVLSARDASGTELTVTATGITAGDFLYRAGQPTIPDLSGAVSDYGTVTEVMAGLESLAAADGRNIHGITMSGSSAGSRTNASGAALDVKFIQEALSQVKVNVGGDRYSWKMMAMAPESHDSLIESRETDRRFNSWEDNKRGTRVFGYQHENDALEVYSSEYCPKKRIYMLPESKGGDKVLEYWGSDFETVKAQGMSDFHLKPSASGGHVNTVVSYLSAIGVIVAKHPAAIAVVENFTA